MMIKYFYQVGHQTQFDKKNGMVILDVKQVHLSRHEIMSLLEKDKVELNKIESLKYWDKKHEGWVEVSDSTLITRREKEKELQLMLKMGGDTMNTNNDLQVKMNNLIKSLSSQEQRIKELEGMLKNFSMPLVSISSGLSQSNWDGGLELARNPSSANLCNVAQFFSDDSRLDIAFLYSNPLVKESNNGIKPLNEPIDFEAEINCLVEVFQETGKKISARFEVANLDNISEIIRKKPRVLHISCHGAYEEIDGESKFFLHFEDNKGKLDKFDQEKLSNLLKSSVEDKSQIEIVFVSACHSEAVANVFREAKVPAVVCVHSATKVLDEAAQRFAKNFYMALLDGKSLAYSFDQAKRIVSAGIDKNSSIPHCCCSHRHEPNCRWHEESMKDQEKAHQYHLKQCKCNYRESHIHTRNCPWAKLLLEDNFESVPVESNPITERSHVESTLIKICCCSPLLAHDESNKFLLEADNDFSKETPFSGLPPGKLQIKNKNCCLNINFSVEMKTSLIGRNIELYNVISVFSSQNPNKNRLVTVYGKEGVGKNSFVKLAGKYMFERKFFPDGVIYVNSRGHNVSDTWFISKILSSLELDNPIENIQQFCKLISQLRILIIINFSRQHEETLKDIKRMMKVILEHKITPKFLIALEKPLDLDASENKILLEPLVEFFSAKLLMTLAGEYLPIFQRNDLEKLAKSDFIKYSEGIPGKIHQIAGMLQEHKKPEALLSKIKEENEKKQNLSDQLVKVLLENMSKNSTLIYEILYLLSILPNGILDCEITKIYKNNYCEVTEILDHIAKHTAIITKYKDKDLKQTVYILADDLIPTVDSLSIEDSIKMKCYRELVVFYGNLVRHIVVNLNFESESVVEFSAAQNQGMWLSLSKSYSAFKEEKVFQPAKRFDFNESNILSIIKVDNRFLQELMNQQDEEFIESIEQLSICMPTILKIAKKNTDFINSYNYFKKICDKYKLSLALGRLYLFKASLHSHYNNSSTTRENFFSTRNTLNNLNYDIIAKDQSLPDLIHARSLFESKKFEEGEAEASFVKAVIMYEREVNRTRYSLDRLSKEAFDEIQKELERAIKTYRRIHNNCGLARASFILAEYCVFNKHFEQCVLEHYQEAKQVFEKDGKKILLIKSLQGISKWYMGIKNYAVSKDFAEQAKLIAEKMNSKNGNELILHEINKLINEILDQSKFQSHNVFVFIKAHQLVKMHLNSDLVFSRSQSIERCYSVTNKDIEYTIDPIINHYSTFRDRMNERFNKSKKELIIKFDFLTEHSLRDVVSKHGRVLHISSDDYSDQGSLFVEGPDGESLELFPNQIRDILMTNRCLYDLVILAIPQGQNLAQLFVDCGVKHVICFKFMEEFIKQCEGLPLISFHNIIHEFTITLLNEIILEQTVEDAFESALRQFNSQMANLRLHVFDYRLRKDVPDFKEEAVAVCMLLPVDRNHQVKLYGFNSVNEETVLFEGKLIDLSKVRARMHNIKKRNHAVIGRKREIYHGVKMTKSNTLCNLYGETGCGKTFVAKEVCYFLYMRNYFKEGIFYFDIAEVRNVEKIKALFHEAEVYAAIDETKKVSKDGEERKVLIVFDNADKIVKYSDNQFFLYLNTFNSKNKSSIHFLIVSNKKIENANVKESSELPPLNPQEACCFFLYFVNRIIEQKEIDIDPLEQAEGYKKLMERIQTRYDLVSVSLRVKSCKGMPKYLKKLAELALHKPLKTIDWRDLNLPRKMNKSNVSDIQENYLKSSHSFIQEDRTSQVNQANNGFIRRSTYNNTYAHKVDNLAYNNNNMNDVNMNLNSSVNFQTGQGLNTNYNNRTQMDQSIGLLSNATLNNLNNLNNTAAPNLVRNSNAYSSNDAFNSNSNSNKNHSSNSNTNFGIYFNNLNSLNSSLNTEDRDSITRKSNSNSISQTQTKTKVKRKKKQSEILEVEEEEKELKENDGDEAISIILRPSDNRNTEDQSEAEEDGDEEETDSFINNQVFPQAFNKGKQKSNLSYHVKNENSYFELSNNPTFSLEFFNQNQNREEINLSNGNMLKNSLNVNVNEINIPSSRSDSFQGQKIIIQNFFNGPSSNTEENSVNMNINIRSSHKNSNFNDKNKNVMKNPFNKVVHSNLRDRLPSSEEEASNHDELSEEEVDAQSLTQLSRTQSNINSSSPKRDSTKTQPKKKQKKGMQSGKMHNKYKHKRNNKYEPNKRKMKKEDEE